MSGIVKYSQGTIHNPMGTNNKTSLPILTILTTLLLQLVANAYTYYTFILV
jgi:hypothetical protein